MTLLIVAAISMLMLGAVYIALLQNKMARSYHDQFLALSKAESILASKENWLLANNHESPPDIVKISTAVCGVTFYRIFVYSNTAPTKISLQSTYAIVDPKNHCKTPPKITTGEQARVTMN
jgi:Tfp pilus assembly protein PilX